MVYIKHLATFYMAVASCNSNYQLINMMKGNASLFDFYLMGKIHIYN
jgi:hypothetical protein